jgi:hypothetical protein
MHTEILVIIVMVKADARVLAYVLAVSRLATPRVVRLSNPAICKLTDSMEHVTSIHLATSKSYI